MPVHIDISENKVFARAYQRGFKEGQRLTVRRMLEKRFGVLPDWDRPASRPTFPARTG